MAGGCVGSSATMATLRGTSYVAFLLNLRFHHSSPPFQSSDSRLPGETAQASRISITKVMIHFRPADKQQARENRSSKHSMHM